MPTDNEKLIRRLLAIKLVINQVSISAYNFKNALIILKHTDINDAEKTLLNIWVAECYMDELIATVNSGIRLLNVILEEVEQWTV